MRLQPELVPVQARIFQRGRKYLPANDLESRRRWLGGVSVLS